MKYASFTEDTIWSIEVSEAAARSEGEATMTEMGQGGRVAELRVAPIDEALEDALAAAEGTGQEVLFELLEGALYEVEVVEA
jgi:hypothetical protein